MRLALAARLSVVRRLEAVAPNIFPDLPPRPGYGDCPGFSRDGASPTLTCFPASGRPTIISCSHHL
jgi:hypothetical protein